VAELRLSPSFVAIAIENIGGRRHERQTTTVPDPSRILHLCKSNRTRKARHEKKGGENKNDGFRIITTVMSVHHRVDDTPGNR